ncbi:hypothetical protein [Dyella mobilis]|uniref:Uncharacterized protein n=1 Tax=Dyella mobilis TaxID=1849582 RepID=A0ABS2KDK8_9GAMM|nr:hypothetical protein [Dyella mobilis]MBM7129242.1 hypothetical protein [Dyella mobilis]GLQ98537.1 hypothetical protein GCM10007863_29570 [Dyella mobilis]
MLALPNGIVAAYGCDAGSQIMGRGYANASGVVTGDLACNFDSVGHRISRSGSLALKTVDGFEDLAGASVIGDDISAGVAETIQDSTGN